MQNNTKGINDKRLILIVEDEAVNRALLGAILENEYEVIFAGDGTEALRKASENKTVLSLVILDLIMPGMPGQEVLRRIKANPEYQDIPVIVLKLDMQFIRTAFGQEKDTHMLEIIIEIARHLSAPVVAEGVETEEQVKALKEIGCDLVQGYFFSPPVSPEKFASFLSETAGQIAA